MPGKIDLVVPTLTTPGPAYASQISNDLNAISTHTHDGVNAGATIDIAAQACNEDLSLEHHNLSNVRSVEFDNEPAQLTGSQDVLCLYVNQGNLGFNTGDGTFIPITAGDSLAPSALNNFVNWTLRNGGVPVSSNASVLYTDTYNFVAVNSVTGPITITLPIASAIVPASVRVGRLYVFRDVNNAAGANPITIQVAPGSGNTFADSGATSFVINVNGGYLAIYTDGVSTWFPWDQNVYQGENIAMNAASALTLSHSTIAATADSTVTVDATSSLIIGGTLGLFSAAAVTDNTTLTFTNGSHVVHATGTDETFQSGSSETFQSGSSLTCSAGSTVACAGTATITGTTSISGTTSITGPTTITVTGLSITGNGTSTVTLSKASTLSDVGTAIIGGMVATTAFPSPGGTFNCDAGSQLDNFIGCTINNSTNYTINLPNPAAVGRQITVALMNDAFTFTSWSVNVSGSGNLILGSLSNYVIDTSGGPVNFASVVFTFVGGGVGWLGVSVCKN